MGQTPAKEYLVAAENLCEVFVEHEVALRLVHISCLAARQILQQSPDGRKPDCTEVVGQVQLGLIVRVGICASNRGNVLPISTQNCFREESRRKNVREASGRVVRVVGGVL